MATKNAAATLAEILEHLHVPKQTLPESLQGFESGVSNVISWRHHVELVNAARAVDNLLVGMEAAGQDVSLWMPHVPAWYAGVCFAATPWGNIDRNQDQPACPAHSLQMLGALAQLLDRMPHLVIHEDVRRGLADTLATAQELLSEDDQLDEQTRVYIGALIARAQVVLAAVDTYGAETLRSVTMELAGAMLFEGARADGTDRPAGRWRAAALFMLGSFSGGAASHSGAAIARGAAEGIKQIAGG